MQQALGLSQICCWCVCLPPVVGLPLGPLWKARAILWAPHCVVLDRQRADSDTDHDHDFDEFESISSSHSGHKRKRRKHLRRTTDSFSCDLVPLFFYSVTSSIKIHVLLFLASQNPQFHTGLRHSTSKCVAAFCADEQPWLVIVLRRPASLGVCFSLKRRPTISWCSSLAVSSTCPPAACPASSFLCGRDHESIHIFVRGLQPS
ncbi:hypothetical protein BDZ89DRAFT_574331 [Hymenopellis radicata]|nr:hypothetical protein BDZ89DRAFT_574022 [Hymenopellis radicata]KAF9032700.1 hypothetical protein BDZ89DRAFT_574331 [Hymenopellis radicata]